MSSTNRIISRWFISLRWSCYAPSHRLTAVWAAKHCFSSILIRSEEWKRCCWSILLLQIHTHIISEVKWASSLTAVKFWRFHAVGLFGPGAALFLPPFITLSQDDFHLIYIRRPVEFYLISSDCHIDELFFSEKWCTPHFWFKVCFLFSSPHFLTWSFSSSFWGSKNIRKWRNIGRRQEEQSVFTKLEMWLWSVSGESIIDDIPDNTLFEGVYMSNVRHVTCHTR